MIRLWIKADCFERAWDFANTHGLGSHKIHPSSAHNPIKHVDEQVVEIEDCDAALAIAFPKVLNWYAEVVEAKPMEQLPMGTLLYYTALPE